MSRVIEFRGVSGGEFVYGLISYNDGGEVIMTTELGWTFEIDEETISQFTGLKDKNGVEIFKGDIIPYHGKNYPVVMSGPSWTLSEYEDLDYYGHDAPELQDWSEFEVIGNIHQNPELLEQ